MVEKVPKVAPKLVGDVSHVSAPRESDWFCNRQKLESLRELLSAHTAIVSTLTDCGATSSISVRQVLQLMRVGYSGIREGAHGPPGANQRALGASAKLNAFAFFCLARLWIPIIARVVCQKVPGRARSFFGLSW